MDHTFKDLIGKFMADYQDDLTIYSKHREIHFKHLREVFVRCIILGIFLNLNRWLFTISEGRLLVHIVSGKGIYIYPKRIEAINELNPPVNKKGVKSFFGKINFVQRFILEYASTIKPITKILRKDRDFEWSLEVKKKFYNIKVAIA